jgi:BON domain-containing protein
VNPIVAPALVLLAISLPAWAADTKAAPAKPVPSQGATAQQDKEIEAAIRVKLARSKIGKDGFTVKVQGGVATWEGSTGVIQHKGAATRMAKSSGAKKVINNIKVSDQAKAQAAGNLEQGRRRAQIKRGDARSQ